MRAGYRVFPISPRNSERGVANLLQKMKVEYLIVTDAMRQVAKGACEIVRDHEHSLTVTLLDAPMFDELFSKHASGFVALPALQGESADGVALILHSSGSQLIALILIPT